MKENRNTKALKGAALFLSVVCYVGAVAYGDIMFLQVMSGTFPTGFLGAMAMAGAVMTALSAVTLPLALHFWFSPGLQFIWGIVFWVLDIVVLGLNAILAYQTSIEAVDPTVAIWGNFSPATPMLAIIGWGLAYLLDPSHAEQHSIMEARAELAEIRRRQRLEAANSQEVFDIIQQQAIEEARSEASLTTGKHVSEFSGNGTGLQETLHNLTEKIGAGRNRKNQ